jgi:hypothetical protein
MEEMEKRYGFTSVHSRKSEAKMNPSREPLERRPTQAEYQFEERTGLDSDRRALKRLIDAALTKAKNISEVESLLRRSGVKIQLNQSKTGHVSGVCYEYHGGLIKGSTLGKKYAYGGIIKQLQKPVYASTQLGDLDKVEGLNKPGVEILGNPMEIAHSNVLSFLKGAKRQIKRNACESKADNDLQLKSRAMQLDIS